MKGAFITIVFVFGLIRGLIAQPFSGLTTLDGKPVSNLEMTKQKATVFIFVSPECPLCQSYSLTLNKLYQHYSKQNMQFIAVVPGTYFTKQQVTSYIKTYHISFPVYFDRELKLVKQFKATITPEVFVVNAAGKMLYSGRIDNWAYALGKKRTVVTENDLAETLKAITEDKLIPHLKTKAIGCFIE